MKFRMLVRDGLARDGSIDEWWEEHDKPVTDPEKWAKAIVARFNCTLRPGEKRRELVEVEILDVVSFKEHTWKKQNLTTVLDAYGGSHDVMKCKVCGITGKRYGLGPGIALDPKYARSKVYQRCDTAKRHLERLEKKRRTVTS